MNIRKLYSGLIFSLLLIPNMFVILFGIESFPYTSAPMFGHYIDTNTDLYLFKFEGVTQDKTTDLIDYLGKPEDFFMRHFFSKVYGSTHAISPFASKLSESDTEFQNRMNLFFEHYSLFLKKNYHLTFEHINFKALKVNQEREILSEPIIVGYYDCLNKIYVSAYKNTAFTTQLAHNTK